MKKLEVKTIVTQTVERTYRIEVPEGESDEDIKELFESMSVGDVFIIEESDERTDVSESLLSITDLVELQRKKEEQDALQMQAELKADSSQDSCGRF